MADVVQANLLAATAEVPMRGELFNVSGDKAYSVNELLAAGANTGILGESGFIDYQR